VEGFVEHLLARPRGDFGEGRAKLDSHLGTPYGKLYDFEKWNRWGKKGKKRENAFFGRISVAVTNIICNRYKLLSQKLQKLQLLHRAGRSVAALYYLLYILNII